MTETERIRVLIADDHAIVREGLQALISSEPSLELIGEAADGLEAVQLARSLQPDVILLDLVMPRKSGLEAIVEIKQDNPAARILVLTSFAEDDKVFPAIKSGALGYLLKDSLPHELLQVPGR
jgi:NarL family two-component system response regulator LiaR